MNEGTVLYNRDKEFLNFFTDPVILREGINAALMLAAAAHTGHIIDPLLSIEDVVLLKRKQSDNPEDNYSFLPV